LILTDREIRVSIENSHINIDPAPTADAYASTAVDLVLDPHITTFNDPVAGISLTLDPAGPGYSFNNVIGTISKNFVILPEGYSLKPKCLILAWTKEKITLPILARVAARVEGKSSLARIGLAIHVTAPTIHAGFSGRIQLEVINHGSYPIILRSGMKICQLIFEQTLGVADKGYSGQFLNQNSG
jgi:dCTP deaminase